MIDLEPHVEADDGIVEVGLVLPHLTFPWASLPEGPRRWAPTDMAVEADGPTLQVVRMVYRTVGDRVVVVAAARPDSDIADLAERLATPLLFAHYRRLGGGLSPAAIMAALRGEPVWDDEVGADGWRPGHAGAGERPVRLVHRVAKGGHLLVAAHGVAVEELAALVDSVEPLTGPGPRADVLHARHRRALAQRWWDAPRAPWAPSERDA